MWSVQQSILLRSVAATLVVSGPYCIYSSAVAQHGYNIQYAILECFASLLLAYGLALRKPVAALLLLICLTAALVLVIWLQVEFVAFKEGLNKPLLRRCEELQATKQSSSTLRKRRIWIATTAPRPRDDGLIQRFLKWQFSLFALLALACIVSLGPATARALTGTHGFPRKAAGEVNR